MPASALVPRIAGVVIGVLVTCLGAALVVRPFASLGVLVVLVVAALVLLGIGELSDKLVPGRARLSWLRVPGGSPRW